jgi:hypothetical protein
LGSFFIDVDLNKLSTAQYARLFASTVDTALKPRQSTQEMTDLLNDVVKMYETTPGASPSDVCKYIGTLKYKGTPLTLREGIVLYSFTMPYFNIAESPIEVKS